MNVKEKKIWIFGNPDKSSDGFKDREDIERYISHEIFEKEDGRYRFTLARDPDIIVLSREGWAYGHFEIEKRVKPNEADKQAYPRVQFVYLVTSSTLYSNRVKLSELDIKGLSYGYELSQEKFAELLSATGNLKERIGLPHSPDQLIKVFREVRQRLGQSEFRSSIMEAYSSTCAVTGCKVEAALEAAHIHGFADSLSNSVNNGVLLRADVHTLFDRNLLGFEPTTLTVRLASSLKNSSYGSHEGVDLQVPEDESLQPSVTELQAKWSDFLNANSSV